MVSRHGLSGSHATRQIAGTRRPWRSGEHDLMISSRLITAVFGLVGVVEAGIDHAARDGGHSSGVRERPDGVGGVEVNASSPLGKWLVSRFSRDTKSSWVRNGMRPSATITAGRSAGMSCTTAGRLGPRRWCGRWWVVAVPVAGGRSPRESRRRTTRRCVAGRRGTPGRRGRRPDPTRPRLDGG